MPCLLLALGCAEEASRSIDEFDSYIDLGEIILREVNVIGDADPIIFGDFSQVALSSDRKLWVADPSNGWVWMVDSVGTYIGTLGRRGEGPGEFIGPKSIGFSQGDTLLVLDGGQHRISAFGPHPDREFLFSAYVGHNLMYRRSPGDVLGMWGNDILLLESIPVMETGRPKFIFLTLDHRGAVVSDSILQIEGPEILVHSPQPGHVHSMQRPFGRRSWFVFDGKRICHAESDRFHVSCLDQSRVEQTILSFDIPDRQVQPSEVDRHLEWMSPEHRRIADGVGWYRTHPAMDAMVVGLDGRFWIHRPPESSPMKWLIFDTEAQTYRHAHLPNGQRVVAASDRYVYTTMAPGRPEIWIYEMIE